MKKPITATTVLIAILSTSLPAMSQDYEPDFSEIEKLGGPYIRDNNPQYYEGIEAYFEELNRILLLQRHDEKITTNTLITYLDNQLKSDNPNTGNGQEQLLLEYQKRNLAGFINVMNAYIANKLNVDNHNEANEGANTGSANLDDLRKHLLKQSEPPQEDLSSDNLKVFAEAIALYINSDEKITPEKLITYITEQLLSDDEKVAPEELITYITEQLLSEDQKRHLTGFINVMNAYIANKLNVDNHNEANEGANTGSANLDDLRKHLLKQGEPPQEDLSSDNLKVFAETIALYINSDEKITPEELITYITEQLKSDDEKVAPEELITYITEQLLSEYQKSSLTGFIHLMNVYRANKPEANTRLDGPSGLKKEDYTPDEPMQKYLSFDDLKVFDEAIALYVNNELLGGSDKKTSPGALITYINNQLASKEEKVIIKTNTEAFAGKVIEHMQEELDKREIDIKDKTIVTLYSNPPYDGAPNNFLDQLTEEKGFQHESKKDTEFEWSEFPKKHDNLDFIFVRGWGDMYKDTIEKAVENRYLVSILIGNEWSNSVDTLKQISRIADGYKAVTYLNEVEMDVYQKLGVWDAYTSIIKSDKLKDHYAINEACKKLLEENNPCESSENDTDDMTKRITTIKKWSAINDNWEDIHK